MMGIPGMLLVANARNAAGLEGPMETTTVASLVAEVLHDQIDPRTRAATQRTDQTAEYARQAVSYSPTYFANPWVECGTFMGLAGTNSQFMRLCVFEDHEFREEVSCSLDALCTRQPPRRHAWGGRSTLSIASASSALPLSPAPTWKTTRAQFTSPSRLPTGRTARTRVH